MDLKGVFEMTKQKKGVRVGIDSPLVESRRRCCACCVEGGPGGPVPGVGCEAATLSEWREQFLGGGESALHSRYP